MPSMQDDANLVAIALVRRAIELSEAAEPTPGAVAEIVNPYFERYAASEGDPLSGLLSVLSQFAGAVFANFQQQRSHRVMTVDELLARLDDFERGLVEGEQDGG